MSPKPVASGSGLQHASRSASSSPEPEPERRARESSSELSDLDPSYAHDDADDDAPRRKRRRLTRGDHAAAGSGLTAEDPYEVLSEGESDVDAVPLNSDDDVEGSAPRVKAEPEGPGDGDDADGDAAAEPLAPLWITPVVTSVLGRMQDTRLGSMLGAMGQRRFESLRAAPKDRRTPLERTLDPSLVGGQPSRSTRIISDPSTDVVKDVEVRIDSERTTVQRRYALVGRTADVVGDIRVGDFFSVKPDEDAEPCVGESEAIWLGRVTQIFDSPDEGGACVDLRWYAFADRGTLARRRLRAEDGAEEIQGAPTHPFEIEAVRCRSRG